MQEESTEKESESRLGVDLCLDDIPDSIALEHLIHVQESHVLNMDCASNGVEGCGYLFMRSMFVPFLRRVVSCELRVVSYCAG